MESRCRLRGLVPERRSLFRVDEIPTTTAKPGPHPRWACSLVLPPKAQLAAEVWPSVPIASSKRYQKRDAEICPQRQGPEPRTSCSALRHRDRAAPRTCPVFAGIGRQNHKAAQKQGLAGWGARIRTWEWRNQNPRHRQPWRFAAPCTDSAPARSLSRRHWRPSSAKRANTVRIATQISSSRMEAHLAILVARASREGCGAVRRALLCCGCHRVGARVATCNSRRVKKLVPKSSSLLRRENSLFFEKNSLLCLAVSNPKCNRAA